MKDIQDQIDIWIDECERRADKFMKAQARDMALQEIAASQAYHNVKHIISEKLKTDKILGE